MKKSLYSRYKYLPRYYTPSIKSFVNNTSTTKIKNYIANITSLEEIEFLDKELKKKWININKISKNKHTVQKIQLLETEMKQKWACGISSQKAFKKTFKNSIYQIPSVNNVWIDLCKKEDNYVIDEVDYIDYKHKYNL